MKKIYLFTVAALCALMSHGQTRLAAWSFEALTASPNTEKAVAAELGLQAGTAALYADGTEGSSDWTQNGELNSFGGSTLGDPKETPSNSSAFSIVNSTANGKAITLKFSTTDYQNPILTFSTRGTSTGFNSHQWAWSINGSDFTDFGDNTANTTSSFLLRTLDMTDIDDVDNQETVWLRLTVDGAASTTGNNRLDNFDINASLLDGLPDITFEESLSDFATLEGTASSSQSFAVSGSNLTADVTVTAPEGFEISNDDATYSSSLVLSQVSGNLTDQPVLVYVRVSASATSGSISDVISLESTGATTKTIGVKAFIASNTPLSLPYDQSFAIQPEGWYTYSVSSALTWSFSKSGYYIANAFSDDVAAEDWLISPPLDGSETTNAHFSFESRQRFTDNGEADPLRVFFSTDYLGYGDPEVATWTDVSSLATFGAAVSGSNDPHTFSDFIDVSSASGKFYVAFVYQSSGTGNGGSSEIRVGEFSVGEFTAWDGTEASWTNGAPNTSTNAKISGAFSTATHGTTLEANDLYAASGLLTISAGNEVVVQGELTNNGEISVESGGALALFGSYSAASTGTTQINRNTTGLGGYSILGSPITDAQLSGLSADYLYGYDPATEMFTQPTGAMTSGAGYFVGFDAASPSVSFTGTPNTGTIDVAVTNAGDGFNLVANPYAAAISIGSLTFDNASIDGVIYLWDDGGTNEGEVRGGDYITVSELGQTVGTIDLAGTGQTGETPAENGFITSVQGFFVKATASGNLRFTADMQEIETSGANADANHYRKIEDKQLVRLSIAGNGLYNEILVGLTESATLAADRSLDASKFSGNELISFYSIIDNAKYAIQALPNTFDEVMEVQLGFDLVETGTYTLKVNELKGIAENVQVNLFDKVTGLSYDLSKTENITFSNTTSSFNNQRFKLLFSKAAVLGFDLNKSSDTFKVYTNESGLNIETLKTLDNVAVKIYGMNGAMISTFDQVDLSTQKSTLPFTRNGLFIITIESGDQLMVKKFLN